MPKTLYLYTDGKSIKNIDLPQYPDAKWDWITAAPDTASIDLYSKVSAVYRAANLNADAISNMPFALLDRQGNEYDVSDNWQNKVGFMKRPRELLRLWRLSLFMTNSAYGFMEGNRAIRNLRYLVPTTITPIADRDGLQGFKRTIGGQSVTYSLDDNRIFYLWRLDHTTELLPSAHTEFKALMTAAGVLYYADHYVEDFFKRGGIKPTMLMVKGVPTPQDREKIESVWDKFIKGKFLSKVFNADAIEPHVIGEGIDNLKQSELHNEKLADIAMAAGMPLSLLVANSANYATAQTEYEVWFRDTIIPMTHFLEDGMNEQIFEPMGLHFEFRPEVSDRGTEEEAERAQAYHSYVSSGMKPSIAARLLGLEMPSNIEYESLDDVFIMPENKTDKNSPVFEPEEIKTLEEAPTVLTIEQLRELELWQDMAFRKLKRGESLLFPFVCKSLTEPIASSIRAKLPRCKSREDIESAFQMQSRDDDAILALAEALNLAVSKLEENGA